MQSSSIQEMRIELSLKAKNGINFILAASVTWFIIGYVWSMNFSAYDRSILTFMVGGMMLPLAFVFGKLLKTTWKIKNNPLEPLGLWLNFSQLIYFPFLIFVLRTQPDYFLMTYIIITGAHFFPYAWFYNEITYAIFAVIISVGALLLGLYFPLHAMYMLGIFMGCVLLCLALCLYYTYRRKSYSQKLV